MSTQTIIASTDTSLHDSINNSIVCLSNKYLLNVNFGIGGGYDLQDFKNLNRLHRLLCVDYCGIKDLKLVKEEINLINLKYN